MKLDRLISPRGIERISESDFSKSFLDCLSRIDDGVIFLITDSPSMSKIYREFVLPAQDSKRYDDFRMNAPFLHAKQLLQRAAFSNLPLSPNSLVDSIVRLRRTVGAGAFVGPHVDFHENLPANALNFWISFSQLEQEEAIQFLPERWVLAGTPVGHFKAGVHLDGRGRILPFDDLVKSSISSAIMPGEYFVFKSGRTPHCSPFFVKADRVTADQRILLSIDPAELSFASLTDYYPLEWMDRFNGARSVKDLLSDFWTTQGQSLRNSSALSKAELLGPVDRMRENPQLAHKIAIDENIPANAPGMNGVLAEAFRSVALRVALLQTTPMSSEREKLCFSILDLVPESPAKTYAPMARSATFRVFSAVWRRATTRTGRIGASMAVVIFFALWIVVCLSPFFPDRVRVVAINKISWLLWRCLNSDGTLAPRGKNEASVV